VARSVPISTCFRATKWFRPDWPLEKRVADLARDPYGWHMPLAKTTGLRCRYPGDSHRGLPGVGPAPDEEQQS
jgi:hypothetical protein